MTTYQQIAQAQLRRLCTALGIARDAERHEAVRQRLFEGWGEAEIPESPPYPSSIGDDHSPFEYSLALGGQNSELRLLFEVQARTPGLLSNRAAALAFNERLVPYGVSLARFERIRDLFLPDNPKGPFTLWHAVTFGAGQPDFKVYLNPAARGDTHAWPLVVEALHRLGLPKAAATLKQAATRASGIDQPNYFSLDLTRASTARVKVYLRHAGATGDELERIVSMAPSHRPGDAIDFCRAMVGHVGPFTSKPPTTCFSFVEGRDEPTAVTMHMPVAHYLENDATVRRRVATYLNVHRLSYDAYDRALGAMASRALEVAAGIQSYASYRREPGGMRVTSYLSPELFRSAATGASHARLKAVDAQHAASTPSSDGVRKVS